MSRSRNHPAAVTGCTANRDIEPFQYLLLSDVVELVNAAALKKAVMHHFQSEQISGHHEGDQEQELCYSNPA